MGIFRKNHRVIIPHPKIHLPHHIGGKGVKSALRRMMNIIAPSPFVGGLDISHAGVRFVRIEDDSVRQASVQFMPGTMEEGRIKDRKAFIEALKKLHDSIEKPKKKIQIVLSIPGSNVYTEVFKLPFLSKDKLHEAAHLNLQMISPLPIDEAYYDAQAISDIGEGGQVEFLGAFVRKEVADECITACESAGFTIVAVEFPGLALTRVLRELGMREKRDGLLIGIMMTGVAVRFFLVRNESLYFHYTAFIRPSGDAARSITDDDVAQTLIGETHKIFNFVSSRRGGETPEAFVLIAPGVTKKISTILEKNFNLPVEQLTLSRWSEVDPLSYPALGSALRGVHPRSADVSISLTAVGTERRYEHERIIYFTGVWRNIILSTTVFFMVAYLIAYGWVARYAGEISERLVVSDATAIRREITPLQSEAREFNRVLGLYAKARANIRPIASLPQDVAEYAQSSVFIRRITFDGSNNVSVTARAISDSTLASFREKIERDDRMRSVTLPLSSLVRDVDGGVTFQVRFRFVR